MAGNRSKISRLPAKVRDKINALIKAGCTIDEIMTSLERLDVDVSRSALGRYKQKTENAMRRYREAQQVAGVWIEEMGQDGDVSRLLQEMLKTIAFQKLAEMGDDEAESIDPKDLHFFARAVKDLEGATKLSVDRAVRIEERQAAAAKLDRAVSEAEAAGEKGLSAERIAQLRRDFLGVRDGT